MGKKTDEAVSCKNRNPLIDICWINVKHLEPPGLDNIPGWSEGDQQLLENLKIDGRKDLHHMYVIEGLYVENGNANRSNQFYAPKTLN